jgi:hypothetical protein
MNERCAAKRNRYHINATDYWTKASALHLKILQAELDQNADARRIEDRITRAERELVRLKRRHLDSEELQKAIIGIRDRAVLSIRDVRKNMQKRAAKTIQMQNDLTGYFRQCSRFADDELEDVHFRIRLIELLARTATSALLDHLQEASQVGHMACAELVRFEFQTREDRHAFAAKFQEITARTRRHDPVEMRERLANICSAVKNVDSRVSDLIMQSQLVHSIQERTMTAALEGVR